MTRKGFTLIELLVVIAIIAILAAILFPVFANAKARATQTKCLNNMKQLATALRQYCDDYNGTTPFAVPMGKGTYEWCGTELTGQLPISVDPTNGYDVKNGGLWNYVRNREVYRCPIDRRQTSTRWYWNESSYSLNQSLASVYGSRVVKLDAVTAGRTSKIMLFLEEQRNNDGCCAYWDTADLPSNRHWDGGNIIYVDGHGGYASNSELKAEKNNWAPK